jgi:hypothetical protein
MLGGGVLVLFGLITFQAYRIAMLTAEDLRSAAIVLKVGPEFLLGGSPFSQEAYERVSFAIDKAIERVDNANWSFDVVGAVPMLGRPVHAAEHLVRAAQIELDSIDLARRTVLDISGTDGSRPLLRDGQIDLESLAAASRTIQKILDDLALVEAEVAAVRPIPFAGEATRLQQQALHELKRVRDSAAVIRQGLNVLPSFFGAKNPRVYLLAILNPAELHGVGGAFLSYGIVRADKGRLTLVGAGDPLGLDPREGPGSGVPPPEGNPFLDEIYPVRLVNALNGPDFAEGASLASDITEARYGRALDGVIAVDAVGLSYILPSLGPLKFKSPDIVLNGSNFARFSMNAQYLLYPYEVRQRIQRLTIDRVWGRIGSAGDPFALLNGISRGLSERRVMLWSRFKPEEALFQNRDWAGRVAHPEGDYFLLNHQNLGVDKLDYYLRETVRYHVKVQPSGDAEVEATVTMRNTAQKPDLPEPVGNNDGSKMRSYIGPFVPAGSELLEVTVADDNRVQVNGPRPARRGEGYGKSLFQTIVKIDSRSQAEVVFRYRVPDAVVRTAGGNFYRLFLQHQPLARPAVVTVEVEAAPGVELGPLETGWVERDGFAVLVNVLTRDAAFQLPVRFVDG